MLWVVYNRDTSKIYGKFYLKQQAKDFVKYNLNYPHFKNNVGLDKVDVMKYDKWQMWMTLGGKGKF